MLHDFYSYDFYLASPFFNPEQIEREEAVKNLLREQGFRVFSPKENCICPPDASIEEQERVFQDNLDGIRRSRAVFAITDGKDMGTIWEAGFAYALQKPIIYFAETLGNKPFNLMLARSGKLVLRKRMLIKVLSHLGLDILSKRQSDYMGEIE